MTTHTRHPLADTVARRDGRPPEMQLHLQLQQTQLGLRWPPPARAPSTAESSSEAQRAGAQKHFESALLRPPSRPRRKTITCTIEESAQH